MNFSTNYNWEGKVLLVAEDEDFNFIFLEEILIDTKARIIRARDGQEALDFIKSVPEIDLVLMDMQMPVMNGYDATRNIKKINKNMPIIAQTAYHYGEAYEEIMAAGCDDFVSKPIDIGGLKDMIDRFLF
ncbi:response regulator [Labilibaculum sp. A4]|uniref:Response regulator n=1 Tax=Labilibaculum euxinus TaxID=2686357 RepID=A0A425Y4U9_9BACT|nr:response regulator [Labilibaculum euxinus]MDQ1772362.1 response regulator [Labilibaculum euxinus]MUP37339.1 response regulator [Labilibaculum euxinus]MVB06544.1 response regulator [Labilibaculum euxinus]MWN78066.1 response regulator [Labilibaculum euxinus]